MSQREAVAAPRNWVVHDYLQVNGGAERLVITLARGLPDFGLAVSSVYPDFSGTGDLDGVQLRTLGHGPAGLLPRVPRALLAFGRRPGVAAAHDTVIYSGLYAPLAVHGQGSGARLYYCHTPPRFAFEEEESYLRRAPALARPALRLAIARYRRAWLEAVAAMDVVMTNSEHVRQRLRRHPGVDARVIYPPVDLERFRFLGQQGYYLSVARLEPNKRVERIVRAFLGMPDQQLVVASGGSELERLRALAGGAPNIRFLGWVDDARLAELVGGAVAVLYVPRDEDFGISAVEAMAAGKPVIGVREGGLAESVVDGETGVLLEADPTADAIAAAVARMTPEAAAAMRPACGARARRFSRDAFLLAVAGAINEARAARVGLRAG